MTKPKYNNEKVFLTKVWGYEPETYPFIGFSEDGRRSSYIKEADHGDWLVMVGTKQPPSTTEEQGKLLGLVQLGKDPLDSIAVLKEINTSIKSNQYNEDGSYKWPYALPFLTAYKFAELPDCKEIFGDYLSGFHWAKNAVKLNGKFDNDLIHSIFQHKLIKTDIHEIPSLKKANIYSKNLRGSKNGATGPAPSHSKAGSTRESGKGYAYALKLVGRDNNAFKIGSTSNLTERFKTLNRELRPFVTGCSWELILKHEFDSENYAFNFEQLLHKHFKNNLFEGETEIFISKETDIQEAWTKVLFSKDWIPE